MQERIKAKRRIPSLARAKREGEALRGVCGREGVLPTGL
jgi:hypothetical protein